MVGISDWDVGYDVTLKGADEFIRQVHSLTPMMRPMLEEAIQSLGLRIRDRARELAAGEVVQERTGRLENSINFELHSTETSVIGRVYSDDPADETFEFGAVEGPRDILPNTAQALRFAGGGSRLFFGGSASQVLRSLPTSGEVYAKVVHRPAVNYEKRPIIHRAFDEMASVVDKEIRSAVRSHFIYEGGPFMEPSVGTQRPWPW